MVRTLLIVTLLLVASVVPAQDATPQQPNMAQYRIGPRDVLEVRVFEVPQLNKQLTVTEDGLIQLPLIGDMEVTGLTANQVADQLRATLEEKYVQRASVTVEIKEFRSRPISVIGAVRRPGNLAVSGRWTLLEAIAAAGGLSEEHGDQVLILRRDENGLSDQLTIYLDDLMVDAKPEYNIPVFSGDLINIPATFDITLFCLGEVARPGAVTFKSTERRTLLAAIARAGGLTDRASNTLIIRRMNRDGSETEIEVDYKDIVSGKVQDPVLEASDVVVAKESFF